MKSHARVVVIGGGVGGCSTLYHLTKLGWSDVVLIERDELTSGSTWHAAGQVTQFGTFQTMVALKRYSTELYAALAADPEFPINYHIAGGLRLAHTRDHLDGYRHFIGMARGVGVDFELVAPEEMARRHPLLNVQGLAGALWDPIDGDIDPSQLTQALARGARAAGAEIYRFTPVTALERTRAGEWRVRTEKGDIACEIIVNASGYRVNEVGAMLGVEHPVVSMEHQYLLTEPIAEIEALDFRVPLIRDPLDDFYSRQEKTGLLVGIYEQGCRPWGMQGVPRQFTMELLPNDLERLGQNLDRVIARLPVLSRTGITRVVNGPITYSADGLPLVGKIPGLCNAYACLGLRAGIGEGGGHGKCLAEIIVFGECEWDTWGLDPRRFTAHANTGYTVLKAIQEYQREFVFELPGEHRPAGRPAKTTPLYSTLMAQGAEFGAVAGWERVLYFKPPDPAFRHVPSFRHSTWFDTVGAECRAVHERVGLMEVSGFTRIEVSGPEAAAYLDRLVCGALPRMGRIALGYFLTARGHVAGEATITRLDADRFWLLSAATAEYHDWQWLSERLPDGGVHLENLSARYVALVLAGPRSRELLAGLSGADLTNEAFPWLAARRIRLGFCEVEALRVSFSGELGYELHVPVEHLLASYRLLTDAGAEHGLTQFGLYAADSMRTEKCYHQWRADLITEHSPLESGLARFVKLDKGEFEGREALREQQRDGIESRFVAMIVECEIASAHSGDPLYAGGELVGTVTSGAYGHRVAKNIALGFVKAEHASPGRELEVAIIGDRYRAVVVEEPIFDPQNARPRGVSERAPAQGDCRT